MKQNIHAIATALVFFSKNKEQSVKKKDFGFFGFLRREQLTRRLPQPPLHKASPSGFAMTGEGEGLQLKEHTLFSNNLPLTKNSALVPIAIGTVKVRKFLHFRFSNWRSGGFLVPFELQQKELAFRGNEREDFQSKAPNQYKQIATTPFNSPASGGHWAQNFLMEMWNGLRVVGKLSQKPSTNRWSLRPGAEPGASLITMTGRRKGTAVKLRPNILMLLFMVVIVIGAGQTMAQLRPLQIGDQLPDIHLTKLLGADSAGISLKDYKGKVLLLDFWSTYCGACIAAMPHILQLKERMKDSLMVLPVNSESKERIQKVWLANPNLKTLPVYTAYADEALKQLFPHRLFPHLVWVSPEGKYLGATLVEYATAENIRAVWRGEEVNFAQKNDQELFDVQKLALHSYFDTDTAQHFYPYIQGMSGQSRMMVQPDSSIRYYAVNTSMAGQYAMGTYFEGLAFEPKRRVLVLPDPKAYEYQKAYGYRADWEAKYAFSYERYFPKGTTAEQMHRALLEDLNAHFGLEGRIATRSTQVWELRKSTLPNPSFEQPDAGIRLNSWIAQLNQLPSLPWVVNKSGLPKTAPMPALPKAPSLKALQQSLAPYGLQLIATEASLPTFYLTPKPVP